MYCLYAKKPEFSCTGSVSHVGAQAEICQLKPLAHKMIIITGGLFMVLTLNVVPSVPIAYYLIICHNLKQMGE